MKTLYYIAAFALGLVAIQSCKKAEEVEITISNPLDSAVFQMGDTVRIRGEIKAPFKMQGYSIKVANRSFEVEAARSYEKAEKYTIDEVFIHNSGINQDFTVKFQAKLNKRGRTAEKTAYFKVEN